jgi:hypothetical protein
VTNSNLSLFPLALWSVELILHCKTVWNLSLIFAMVWVTHSIVNSKITVKSVLHLLDLLGVRLVSAPSPKNISLSKIC